MRATRWTVATVAVLALAACSDGGGGVGGLDASAGEAGGAGGAGRDASLEAGADAAGDVAIGADADASDDAALADDASDAAPLDAAADVTLCIPGARGCVGNVPRTCNAGGGWVDGTPCPYVCNDASGTCVGSCVPGESQCVGSTRRACGADGTFADVETCPYVCASGACAGVCTPGATRCTGLTPATCGANGEWVDGTPCPVVCADGACGACAPGATRCVGLAPETCQAGGTWSIGAACPFVCSEGACSGTCQPGATRCTGAVAQSCDQAGAWHDDATCPYVCAAGVCTGVCSPGAKRCVGSTPETCDANGAWASGTACSGATPTCAAGVCVAPPSCVGGATGQADCGAGANQTCCASALVPAGSFARDSTHSATLSAFKLDVYEVTVGRFRKFVDAVVAGYRPAAGDGKHSHLAGGGLDAGTEPGWSAAWTASLSTTKAAWDSALSCGTSADAWTSAPGANEKRPINCVTWTEAAAFCIWDGGFLPSEAEWQLAADGAEGRRYPWSVPATSTTIDTSYAVYYPNASSAAVASKSPKGDAKWGHADLAGNVAEWVLDWYASPYPQSSCVDCANVTAATNRVQRGGGYLDVATGLYTTGRGLGAPTSRGTSLGLRCARSP